MSNRKTAGLCYNLPQQTWLGCEYVGQVVCMREHQAGSFADVGLLPPAHSLWGISAAFCLQGMILLS